MSFIGKTLNRQSIFKRYGIDIFYPVTQGRTLKSIDNVDYWVGVLHRLIEKAGNNKAREHTKKGRELYAKDLQKFAYLIGKLEDNDANFIIELPSKKDILKDKPINGKFEASLKAEFKPLTISDYSDQLLHFGDIRLFMTGTLGSKDKFCQWIGIDPKETYYIFVKSPFPKTNRPIIKSYVGSMSGRKGRNPNWRNPSAISKIQEIIKKHKHEKGVIHTSSNQQAWFIKKMLNNKNAWVAQGPTREDTIRRFEAAHKPVILIGAGLKDGVDFKGDKCRYQIMFKMPYPSLAGKQVNIRMHYDRSWYAYQTIMPLMQAYGRGIRDMEDYCIMYVLDSDFDKLLNQYHYLFNEYFLEAIKGPVKPKTIPKPIKMNGGK
jgi:Rad3-related DNA helicase